ncbi:MAG: hypothetical protein AAF699_20895 [Pseudomonadota bacterium]
MTAGRIAPDRHSKRPDSCCIFFKREGRSNAGHPAIAVAAVVGAEHILWGECGVAFMLATGEVAEEDIQRYLRERLANYKLPKALVFVEDFPLLPIGKIDKQALKSRASLIVKESLKDEIV